MSDAARDAIEAVRARWPELFNAGRLEELGEHFYSADARALPPDTPAIQGRDAIVEFFRSVRDTGDVHFDLGVIETVADDRIGYLVGSYVFTDAEGNRWNGVTHEAYRAQPDGSWKCVVDMWHNTGPA